MQIERNAPYTIIIVRLPIIIRKIYFHGNITRNLQKTNRNMKTTTICIILLGIAMAESKAVLSTII